MTGYLRYLNKGEKNLLIFKRFLVESSSLLQAVPVGAVWFLLYKGNRLH